MSKLAIFILFTLSISNTLTVLAISNSDDNRKSDMHSPQLTTAENTIKPEADMPQSKASQLFRSAALGDISDVKRLIKSGANVNTPIKNRLTPLIISSYAGHEAIVRILLAAKANPNYSNRDDETPLITAAASPNADKIVPLLIGAGANVNHKDKFKRTALIAHSQMGHLESVKQLLKAGAKTNQQDVDGQNAAHVSAMKGHTNVLSFLIAAGESYKGTSRFKVTPLMVAARGGHSASVSLLINSGADPLLQGPEKFNALGFSILSGDWKTIQAFKKANIPLTTQASSVGAALHTAIAYKKNFLISEMVYAGAPVNQISGALSPLMIAIARGDAASFKYLLKAGAKPNLKNKGGATALLLAAYMGKLELVKSLIHHGADIHQTNHQGGTALRSAAAGGHTDVVHFLLTKGSKIRTRDKFGKYPIDYAKEKGHQKIISLLQSWNKETASHIH